tara:strand:+ start:2424 stop:2867 length:444 start_codon:yes stop_codon:yes gene_type:complete
MPVYYIGVPTHPYGCRCWKNYKFTGTYDEAAIEAIKRFRDAGFFEDYIEQITDDTDLDDDLTFFCKRAWYHQDYAFLWRNTRKYFAEYLRYDDYEVRRGILDWNTYMNDDVGYNPRNWDEDAAAILTDLTPSSSHEETEEETDEEDE